MELAGSTILVTGGGGMIGSHVIDRLITEHPKEIIAFDRDLSLFDKDRSPGLAYGNVRTVQGDISCANDVKEVLKGVDFVVHAASLLTREAEEDLKIALEVNICSTFNLIEECIRSGVEKLIYSSSISIYGSPVTNPMTEEHPFNTFSMYGAGKVASELFLRVFRKIKGLEYIALRYAVVYGTRQHYRGNLPLFIPESFDRIERGLPPVIPGDGAQLFDYIYAGDVAKANIMALKSPITGESFNIASGTTTSTKDVVQMIIEATGTSLEPIYGSAKSAWAETMFFDTSKAEGMLGFKAEVTLKEGLRQYYNWRKKGESYVK
jgi:UDP-glucose 4-epimerase